ncbi:MAG TPA: hypothetical protein VHW72_10855 [Candidatus Angelobacter sp.]|nr:hypothetical protein [Candidatus Angelobacter sp.]
MTIASSLGLRQIPLLFLVAMVTGCAHKPKPIHVPLVAYTAHINDKDCKKIADNPPRFRCNNVVLDPKEIDATGRK